MTSLPALFQLGTSYDDLARFSDAQLQYRGVAATFSSANEDRHGAAGQCLSAEKEPRGAAVAVRGHVSFWADDILAH